MTQQYYVSRPNMKSDSTALWLWLECSRPELLKEFRLAFNESVIIAVRAREEACYPELVEHLFKVLPCKET